MIKSLRKLGIEGTFLNMIKHTCKVVTDNIRLHGESLNALSPTGNKIGNTFSMLQFSIVLEVLASTEIRRKERQKD